jgi:uncharacterized protein YciI
MVIITSNYVKPLDVIGSVMDEHRKFLDECCRRSKFICCGMQNPGVGGVIIADVGIDEAQTIMKNDPLSVDGSAEYHFLEFTPWRRGERLSRPGWGRTFIFD